MKWRISMQGARSIPEASWKDADYIECYEYRDNFGNDCIIEL
jgi:hypothetical protein